MSRAVARNPWPWIGALLALLLAGWFWYWLATSFERRTETVETGWSAQARRNPYLAAGQFFDRLGIDARSVAGRARLRDLPPATDTLIVRGPGPLSRARRAALLRWIEQGGRLVAEAMVVTPAGAEPREDSLLAAVGVALREDASADGDVIARIDVEQGGLAPIEVAFQEGYWLEALGGAAGGRVEANGRARLLRYRLGDGVLILLSDSVFMTNEAIGRHDHALFTVLLAGDAERVWLLYDSRLPGLPALLWRHAPQALTAAAVLLLLLLWHAGRRLGPLLPAAPRARRDLLLHLDAAADLLARHGRGGLQLAATRARVEQAWLHRHPVLRTLPPGPRARWLAAHTGLDAAALARALDPGIGAEVDDAALVAASRTLQQLWLRR